jgi:glyoxylase-like metal-dependent hydrolase (beta-lactamase superfamily II)
MTGPRTWPEVVPLLLTEFRFPDPALATRRGVVVGYAVRHGQGTLLFDTGFGFGNPALDAAYMPQSRSIVEALTEAGIDRDDVTAVANCHLHADHAGQNAAFPGIPIFVQPDEWVAAHTEDYTVIDWIDFPGARYEPIAGDHDIADGVRIVASPGHTAGHQSLVVATRDGTLVLAGQACYSVGEWTADPDALEGRSSAPDGAAYDRSIERLRGLDPVRVLFAHDRTAWTPRRR